MTTSVTDPQLDSFAQEVNFGPAYRYELFFDRSNPHHIRLPSDPPMSVNLDSGDRCGCESCRSEGWYAESPLCRFWRAHCDACGGMRSYRVPGTGREEGCELCETAWPREVAWFRLAFWDRQLAARILRDQAKARHRANPNPVRASRRSTPADIPDCRRDDDAVTLFRISVVIEDHADGQQAKLDRRDGTALFVAGSVEGLARSVQDFRDLAAAYRAHADRQLIAADPTEPA